MPKLRRLTGKDVIKILNGLGFETVRIRGSHHHLQRIVDGRHQNLNVPVHGNKPISTGTLKAIYRQAAEYIREDTLKAAFYSD